MEMPAVVVMSSQFLFLKIFWFDVQKVSKSKIWKWILVLEYISLLDNNDFIAK